MFRINAAEKPQISASSSQYPNSTMAVMLSLLSFFLSFSFFFWEEVCGCWWGCETFGHDWLKSNCPLFYLSLERRCPVL